MSRPSVSVVIPVRDDAEALARCLAALTRQSVAPLEIVVVDNDSRDDSAAVAAAYGARVVREPVRGIPPAAATGYDAARGEVIARCDADSLPGPDWVRRIADTMGRDPGLDAVTGTGFFHDVAPIWRWLLELGYLGSYYLLTHLALGHTPMWGSSLALRRTTWEQVRADVHRDDPEVHDDMDLAFALGPGRRIRFDARLRVGVSGRSLVGRAQRRRRLERARRTLAANWAVAPPWVRWQRRLERAAASRSLSRAGRRRGRAG